ncbi:MAG TPA: hypothetical protein VKO87_06830 [Gemmatimonadaceae bacterium]|nr:hypothetical protein [Gemmatimonadaceae bacterium]
MARPRSWWRIAGTIFVVINAGGAFFAFMRGEMMHGSVHLALLFGTLAVWQVVSPRAPKGDQASVPRLDSDIEQLQHSVDAIAVEVERIGEGQRFINKLQQEQAAKEPVDRQET